MFKQLIKTTLTNSRSFSTNTGSGSKIGNIIGKIGIGKLNHVAIATPNLQESMDLYKNVFGADVSEPVNQVEHGVTTVFVGLENTKIELLHPFGDKSPIENFLKKNPSGGIHHICLEVDDIHHAVKTLLAENVRIIDPTPKIGAHGKPVVFLHPKSMNGVLVELEEK
ncbi:methylmalonyl-CoA epimerase [Dictyostelium discoideum AX4]|uniref:Methylmalonyl-CoA epimerase, mitochondrial n=1 Tax=Dictyostelium discoideum TaxID=44689 RepID=MCEE_DICDI|nr:methylmalonyl-CoA epimerase [Dictyostelium discoideum AX4]Q553V2.1 RecName: Full=Methylmalonyl-CoA epimerase, mitochondrial; AltName: Full=DL-methylmalonyl-CoA racemase; Flags: Precursor [Dictyostelium discoideum]EAL69871.1 methylmalonyl-CoA epimerase [Dictyostelium discoideum AX4]|eukprot:XP_643859.1 methylmalonyl-CoA epimerase [Dictyostelium discoideum AX4]